MSDHRHATDRTEWTIIAECTTDPDHLSITIDASAAVSPMDDLRSVLPDGCRECGATIVTMEREEPTEVLD